jgi:hypothetical protein
MNDTQKQLSFLRAHSDHCEVNPNIPNEHRVTVVTIGAALGDLGLNRAQLASSSWHVSCHGHSHRSRVSPRPGARHHPASLRP